MPKLRLIGQKYGVRARIDVDGMEVRHGEAEPVTSPSLTASLPPRPAQGDQRRRRPQDLPGVGETEIPGAAGQVLAQARSRARPPCRSVFPVSPAVLVPAGPKRRRRTGSRWGGRLTHVFCFFSRASCLLCQHNDVFCLSGHPSDHPEARADRRELQAADLLAPRRGVHAASLPGN